MITCYKHTIVVMSWLVRLSNSGVHVNLNRGILPLLSTLRTSFRNRSVPSSEAIQEAVSATIGCVVRVACKAMVGL